MDGAESEGPMLVTVEAAKCILCGVPKPRTEFYKSELKKRMRCKTCFRGRIGAANKRKGRRSWSLSLDESKWLNSLCRALPCSDLSILARRPEYSSIARKAKAMADKGAESKRAGETEQEGTD